MFITTDVVVTKAFNSGFIQVEESYLWYNIISILEKAVEMELKSDYEIYLDSYQYSEQVNICQDNEFYELADFPNKTFNTLEESKKSS